MSAPLPMTPFTYGSESDILTLIANRRCLTVTAWPDPVLDRFGHDPRSAYAERFWLAVVGPSSLWLLRLLATRFDDHPQGYEIDLLDTARSIGISSRGGAHSAFAHTVARVVQFGFAQFVESDTIIVRPRLASLTKRQTLRLPKSLQQQHVEWAEHTQHDQAPNLVVDMRKRARALALSLLDLGEDLKCTEQQLHRWKFHPAIAFEAVRWAAEQQQAGKTQGVERATEVLTPALSGLIRTQDRLTGPIATKA